MCQVGGGKERSDVIRKIVSGGVAVMAHIGLTPQSISVLGGFRAQGRTAVKARALLDDALALQDAGAFAVVIECGTSRRGGGHYGGVGDSHDRDWKRTSHVRTSSRVSRHARHVCSSSLLYVYAQVLQALRESGCGDFERCEQYKREVETGTFRS